MMGTDDDDGHLLISFCDACTVWSNSSGQSLTWVCYWALLQSWGRDWVEARCPAHGSGVELACGPRRPLPKVTAGNPWCGPLLLPCRVTLPRHFCTSVVAFGVPCVCPQGGCWSSAELPALLGILQVFQALGGHFWCDLISLFSPAMYCTYQLAYCHVLEWAISHLLCSSALPLWPWVVPTAPGLARRWAPVGWTAWPPRPLLFGGEASAENSGYRKLGRAVSEGWGGPPF